MDYRGSGYCDGPTEGDLKYWIPITEGGGGRMAIFTRLKRILLLCVLAPMAVVLVLALLLVMAQVSWSTAAVLAALILLLALVGFSFYGGKWSGEQALKIKELQKAEEEQRSKLEEERAKREESAIVLERERGRSLIATSFEVIMDLGVLEVPFRMTESYDLCYDKNGHLLPDKSHRALQQDREYPIDGDTESESDQGKRVPSGEQYRRFVGAHTAKFTGRFGFDFRKVRAEYDHQKRDISFVMPAMEFRGISDFPTIEWDFSCVLEWYGYDRYWWEPTSGEAREWKEKKSNELRTEILQRLKKSPYGLGGFLAKPLEQLGIQILRAFVKGATDCQSTAVQQLKGEGKPLLDLCRDLTGSTLSAKRQESLPQPLARDALPAPERLQVQRDNGFRAG